MPRFASLKAYRKAFKLSQREAAARCRMTQQEWSRYETGLRIPRADRAQRMARKTGVAVTRLLGLRK